MVKNMIIRSIMVFLLGAFTVANAQKKVASKGEPKFLDDISVEVAAIPAEKPAAIPKPSSSEPLFALKRSPAPAVSSTSFSTDIEKAGRLQLKFALMLDTEVEQVRNIELFDLIDYWYGTRYRLGGSNKSGIDCSAFMQILVDSVYNYSLPRTAREQYGATRHISRTELREGDLVFFNTRGGVSHVGMYLQNNKFIHASSSGVIISDLFEPYWIKRFIGVGRMEKDRGTLVTNP